MAMDFNDIEIDPEGLICNCGNISIAAEPYKEGEHLYCSQQDFNRLKMEGKQIVCAKKGQIEITNPKDVLVITNNFQHFTLVCKGCNRSFLVIPTKRIAYCCELNQKTQDLPKFKVCQETSPTLFELFPLQLRPFIDIKAVEHARRMSQSKVSSALPKRTLEDIALDSEFDFMFSNRNQCVVGSFTNQWNY